MFLLFITLTDNRIYFVKILCIMLLMYFALYLDRLSVKMYCEIRHSVKCHSVKCHSMKCYSAKCPLVMLDSVICRRSWQITIDAIDATDSPFRPVKTYLHNSI